MAEQGQPGLRKERGQRRVRIEGTACVSHAHIGMALGERGAGHLEGVLRHDVMGGSMQGHRRASCL